MTTATATPTGGYITVLRAGDLFVDHTYQRPLSQPWVDKRIDAFDPRLFGVLDVSDRGPDAPPDRRWAIVNGQHRWSLGIAASTLGPDVPMAVQVYEGLTVADEAAMMHDIDRGTRKLTSWERWIARRIAGDPLVTEIEDILARHELRFATSGAPGSTTATGAAETLHRIGGPGLLDAVLGVLRGAWGDDPAAFHGPFLLAVGQLIVGHGDRLDLDHLTDAMERSRPWDVRSTAHGYKVNRIHDGSQAQLIAYALQERYNRAANAGRRLPALR